MKRNIYLNITIEIKINIKIILIEMDIDKTNSMNFPAMMIAEVKITMMIMKGERW